MANAKKKPPEPDVQWQLLLNFAENGGELTWRNSMADRRNQKRKELLAKALKTFFGIDQEPFDTLPNGLGWACSAQDHTGSVDHGEISPASRKNFRIRRSLQKPNNRCRLAVFPCSFLACAGRSPTKIRQSPAIGPCARLPIVGDTHGKEEPLRRPAFRRRLQHSLSREAACPLQHRAGYGHRGLRAAPRSSTAPQERRIR